MSKEHIYYTLLGFVGAISGLLLLALVATSLTLNTNLFEDVSDEHMSVGEMDASEDKSNEQSNLAVDERQEDPAAESEEVVQEETQDWDRYDGFEGLPSFGYLKDWHIYIDLFGHVTSPSRVWVDTEPVYFVDGEKFFPISIRTYKGEAIFDQELIEDKALSWTQVVSSISAIAEEDATVESLDEEGKLYLVSGIQEFGEYEYEQVFYIGEEFYFVVTFTDLGTIRWEDWETFKEQLDFSDVR